MSSKLDWHFNDYPEVGWDEKVGDKEALHYSDDLIIKFCNGDVTVGCYCAEREEWIDYENDEWVSYTQVVCWASMGKIPESNKGMCKPPKFRNGKYISEG